MVIKQSGADLVAAMDERGRMQYLEAMGIDMYVPRWVLPGALPSRLAPLPYEAEPELTSPVSAPVRESFAVDPDRPLAPASHGFQQGPEPSAEPARGAETASARVSGIMAQLGGTVKSKAQDRPEISAPPVDAGEAENETAVRFTLNIWPVNTHLLVLDSHQPRRGLPTNQLLSNILFAKGVTAFQKAPETLIWPVALGLAGPAGWTAAREMVGEFLGSRLDVRPVSYLWLMGEEAFRAVAPATAQYAQSLGQVLTLPQYDTLALVLPSLSDMLIDPSLKSCTWTAIAPYQVHSD